MNTMANQVVEIGAMFGHTDGSADFAASVLAKHVKPDSPMVMATATAHPVTVEKEALYAQAVEWTSWFVDNTCVNPLTVETDTTGRSVMPATIAHKLPSLRHVPLREGMRTLAWMVVGETVYASRKAMAPLLAALESDFNVKEMAHHIKGGNAEGTLLVADELATLFEAVPPGTPDKSVKLRAMRLGADVRAGMKNSFQVEKIVDALILAHMSPYTVEDAGTDDPRLLFNTETMACLRELAVMNSEDRRYLTPQYAMLDAVKTASALPIDGVHLSKFEIFEAVMTVLGSEHWESPLHVQHALEMLAKGLRDNPFGEPPRGRAAYIALNLFNQWQRKDDPMMVQRLGCPLHHTGKFGKWYRHVAEPMTEWYLQQRAFQQ
jgi:hypothetical protein